MFQMLCCLERNWKCIAIYKTVFFKQKSHGGACAVRHLLPACLFIFYTRELESTLASALCKSHRLSAQGFFFTTVRYLVFKLSCSRASEAHPSGDCRAVAAPKPPKTDI
jgi:hypothetical protein